MIKLESNKQKKSDVIGTETKDSPQKLNSSLMCVLCSMKQHYFLHIIICLSVFLFHVLLIMPFIFKYCTSSLK